MNIIIPMAGQGKRMRPHTLTTPKPLIPIAGKPMVHRIVEEIAATCNEKIEEIAFICGRFGHEAEQELIAVAASCGAVGKIYYQDEPQGTAHAILCAKESLKGHVFVAFADTLFDAKFELDVNKDAIIWTQKVADPSAFGVVKLRADGSISDFVEKPKEFVSDLAIIGVYYFKDGENLRNELQYLIDNNILVGTEYQLTTAMENMKNKGVQFFPGHVTEWLDCGNKDATVYTMERMLELVKNKETLTHPSANIKNSIIIEPCYIGPNVQVTDSVVGPHVSLEADCTVTNSVVKKSIIRNNATINNAILNNSMIGSYANYAATLPQLSIGDYSATT
jgi:glucose-1-phosphate thymidylyltransferase